MRSDDNVQQQVHPDVEEKCRNYIKMLHNLFDMISDYLRLSCSTEELLESEHICIWLEDMSTER